MKNFFSLAVFLCLTSSVCLFGQANATLGGTVSDATGALIPGVEVTATNVNTGIVSNQITNETGLYQFASLQPGAYRLSAALPGFQTQAYENVQLSQGQQVRLNFSLQVGTVAQAIEVTVEADTVLATTSASIGDALPEVEVRSLPLQTRNVLDLVKTTAGAIENNFGGSRVGALNTTRDGLVVSDGRYLDWNGAYSATYVSPDLVEEVQVVTGNVDAESGRGSGQVKLQTRSGTNAFHGALFYSNYNSALNAQGFFQNLVGAKKSYQNRNQFGGRIGGPIIRNKAFFFVLYEGQRFLEKEDFVAPVFTQPARQGVFRYLTENAGGAAGRSRRNGNAFSTAPSVDLSGNTLTSQGGIPLFMNSFNLFSDVRDPNRRGIDQFWVAPHLLSRMPQPNDWTIGDGLNTAGFRWLRRRNGTDDSTGTSPNNNRDQLNLRFDYQLSGNHKLFSTISREEDWGLTNQAGVQAYPEGFSGEVKRFPDIYTAALTSTLSPAFLNEFRFGLRRTSFYGWSGFHKGCCLGAVDDDINDEGKNAAGVLPTLNGYLAHVSAPTTGGLSFGPNPNPLATGNLIFLGAGGHFLDFGAGSTRGSQSPLWSFADTVSWTRGSHSFKSGFEAIFSNSDGWNTGNNSVVPRVQLGVGNIPVPGITGANFGGLNASDITTAEGILALLAGSVDNVQQAFILNSPTATSFDDVKKGLKRSRDFHQNDWSLFFKDDWKVTGNFTLNAGVRYEKYGVPWEANGIAGRPKGGQAGLFGISGGDFGSMWRPGATGGSLTSVELIGKNSPNPGTKAYSDDWNNLAPSIGFSWSLPWFSRQTVLRAGYGINYTGGPTFLQYDSQIGAIPGAEQNVTFRPATYTDLRNVALPLAPTSAPFAGVPLTDRQQTIGGYDDNRVIPYIQNFNISIQRELARNLTLDVAYIGSKGTKLWQSLQLNEPNIIENGILEAFNATRAGGNAPLFNTILRGRNVPGVGVVDGTTITGSEAFRRFATTSQWFANGEVAAFAAWLNNTNAIAGTNGGLLRAAGLPENFVVVNPQFDSVQLRGNNDNSNYHSMRTQVTKRMSQGFSSQFAYTWSKTMGNSAASATSNNTDTGDQTRDPRNRGLQKGLVSFHRTHQFNTHGTWDLPFGPNRTLLANAPSWVHRVVEGWQISGIFTWASGTPLGFWNTRRTLGGRAALTTTNPTNTADLVGVLPDDLGQVTVRQGFVEYFPNLSVRAAPRPNFGSDPNNLAARFSNFVVVDQGGSIVLQNPQPGTTGNTALRMVEGPGRLGFDMALSKRVQIDETRSFTIRADAINALNTPRWGDPNMDINSTTFGRINTALGSRTFTINARIDF